jgi:hypothetical protein
MSEGASDQLDHAGLAARLVMGLALTANAELLAGILLGRQESEADPVLSALSASRNLAVVVDDIQRSLARQARERGRTWAAIGEVLQVTRQAAFQRFGGTPDGTEASTGAGVQLPGAAEAALQVVDDFLAERWQEIRSGFDGRMSQAGSAERLQAARSRTEHEVGRFQETGTPSVTVQAGYTVVDVPLAFERGDRLGRVAFNVDGQVSGFFVLPAEAG